MKTQNQPGRAAQSGNQKRHDEGDRAGQVRGQDKNAEPKRTPGRGRKKQSTDPSSKRHADPEEDLSEKAEQEKSSQSPG